MLTRVRGRVHHQPWRSLLSLSLSFFFSFPSPSSSSVPNSCSTERIHSTSESWGSEAHTRIVTVGSNLIFPFSSLETPGTFLNLPHNFGLVSLTNLGICFKSDSLWTLCFLEKIWESELESWVDCIVQLTILTLEKSEKPASNYNSNSYW